MLTVWLYSIVSVFVVSLISLIGLFTFPIEKKLKDILLYFVSFSAGAIIGDVFIHLLPEIGEKHGFTPTISFYFIFGILTSFLIEKIICWNHSHSSIARPKIHRFAYMILFGDSVHNFIDGLIIGASYLASVPIGLATTFAVVFHEIPHEIGDFGVLIHGGFTKKSALFYNFLTALTAVLGTIFALLLNKYVSGINSFLISFAAANFIYIAGSDLIPELHKEEAIKKGLIQIATFIFGVALMFVLLLLE